MNRIKPSFGIQFALHPSLGHRKGMEMVSNRLPGRLEDIGLLGEASDDWTLHAGMEGRDVVLKLRRTGEEEQQPVAEPRGFRLSPAQIREFMDQRRLPDWLDELKRWIRERSPS